MFYLFKYLGMYLKENFEFEESTKFDLMLTYPQITLKNVCLQQSLRLKWLLKHVSHDTHITFSFDDVIWPGLDLDLYLA